MPSEAARDDAEALFETAFESSPNGILMVDREGRIVLANREIERLFAYSREELIGQPVELLLPQRVRDGHRNYRMAFQGHPQARSMGVGRDLYGRRRDGSEVPVEIGLTPLRQSTTRGPAVLASVVDISARKQAEDDLRRSNEELERFAYVASHDLQEPLRMVASYVDLLARRYHGKLDADADEFIGFARDGALRMQRLIEDLLTLSRIGTRSGMLVPTDAGAVADAALRTLALSITEAGAQITRDALPTVIADGGQLEQVFVNLVSNAIKFRGAEPVQYPRQRPRHRRRVLRPDLHHLPAAARSGQLRRHRHRSCDLQEDRRAPRGPDLGRFHARPGLQLSVHPADAESGVMPARALPPFEVLLVDDNPADVRLVREGFREAGALCRVHVTSDGVQALAFLRGEPPFGDVPRPDLILLDLNLPRKGGREVLQVIKNDDGLRCIPVVVLTTSLAEPDMRESYQLHANAYISKPMDLEHFFKCIDSIRSFWLTTATIVRA